jgi:hypothetical protein
MTVVLRLMTVVLRRPGLRRQKIGAKLVVLWQDVLVPVALASPALPHPALSCGHSARAPPRGFVTSRSSAEADTVKTTTD